MSQLNCPITVLGGGAWGTALAVHLARYNDRVSLWEYSAAVLQELRTDRQNRSALPNVFLPKNVTVYGDIKEAVIGSHEIIVATTSTALLQVLRDCRDALDPAASICWACKGLDEATSRTFDQVIPDIVGERALAVLSGPSFPEEVSNNLPTAVALGYNDSEFADRLRMRFNHGLFHIVPTSDIIGVQLGGVGKNVIAVASGYSEGIMAGTNALSALITIGLGDLANLTVALGGKRETIQGLAGVGDLFLTCSTRRSRNYRFGFALAHGEDQSQVRSQIGQVIEGVDNLERLLRLANRVGVELKICRFVDRIIKEPFRDRREAIREMTQYFFR